MICAPSQMQPSNVQRFAANGIECVPTTLVLPSLVGHTCF